jgi:hypothetical protein
VRAGVVFVLLNASLWVFWFYDYLIGLFHKGFLWNF